MTTQLAAQAIPGIQEPPLVGIMHAFQSDPLGVLTRLARECGDLGRFHYGPFLVYFCNAPELAHSVLVEHADAFDKGFAFHNALRPMIGNGLVNSEGMFWRRQRKLMAPPFQPRHIAGYAATMASYADEAQQGWADGATIDLAHEITGLTMRIVGKVLFDSEVFGEADTLGAAITIGVERVAYAAMHFFPIPLSWPTSRNHRTRRALALIQQRVQAMIDERRASPVERDDFLSILLRAQADDGTRMSDAQLRDEAVTLFLAGHETTANALSWCFYLLASHPEIYARVQAEVDGVLGGRLPAYADLARLPYTLQVLKETIRLYPPAWIINRVALHAVEVAGISLRKKDVVTIPIYTLHRRAAVFPDPERFDPERFTPENEKRLPRHAYMPFGAGPRICIGNHFALMEAHLVLATLAQRVTFRLVPGQQIVPEALITIRQQPGCRVVVARRPPAAPGGTLDRSGPGTLPPTF
ncbi:MAG TPA: cytochrome P450 [Chloroflexia bacterium]|nr:cytochrome P450 [Chloroflexia bacterium]